MNENKKTLYAVFIFLIIGFGLIQNKRSTSDSEISEDEIMNHIRYLSHEKRGGRYPGSRGSKDVIAYIIKQFKSYGIQPGVKNSFVQPFEINTDIILGDSNYFKIDDTSLTPETDYIPFSFSGNGTFIGKAVFAGYGFKIETSDLVWNDYESINVKGKWVIVMRHSPERELQNSVFLEHSSLHKKMLVARDEGALGIIFVSQVEDSNLYPLQYLEGYKNSGIPVLHLSNNSADKMLKREGWTRKKIQNYMNTKLKPLSFNISGTMKAKINLSQITSRAANIVGLIKSGNREFRDEYIVIGAHFDHVGNGGHSSGSRKPEILTVHPGADDNASGTAGLLELAQKLASQKGRLKRSILFIGFDAEEKGLLGSKYFTENPSVDIRKIKAMINMDMIGRMKDSTFTVGGVGTSPVFENLVDSLSAYKNFKLNKTKPGFGPSDHAPFYSKDIPVLFFFSGFHDEYHTPEDTYKLINLKGQKQILDLVYDVVFNLSRSQKPPSFSEAGPRSKGMTSEPSFKVTFGIVPNYNSSVIGLEIDQISNFEGPAAKAGIISGDIIKSINGKKINDVYEYMERLRELKPGIEVPVEINRDGLKVKLSVNF